MNLEGAKPGQFGNPSCPGLAPFVVEGLLGDG